MREGIPILLLPQSEASQTEELQAQLEYFDQLNSEFEITRPRAAPMAYRWLLESKLVRSISGLGDLTGMTVADVFSGSGMEAEFLAEKGARVLAFDLSEDSARRAAVRAERQNLDLFVAVADAQRLPLANQSVDMAYVHDGLHHLSNPLIGLRELIRVASGGVSVSEPADAFLTRLAVMLNLASNVEEAGNRVARISPVAFRDALRDAGFEVTLDRYFMYYQHEPGKWLRSLSGPVGFSFFRLMMRFVNVLVGPFGNKLSIRAWRS